MTSSTSPAGTGAGDAQRAALADDAPRAAPGGVTRRGLLGALGLGVGGVAVGAAAGYAVASAPEPAPPDPPPGTVPAAGSAVEPFHGAHQSGIETALQAFATFVALDLRDGVDREALERLMRLLTDDIARLSAGTPALADPTPELAGVPARLTVTVGVGMGLLEAAGRADLAPGWLAAGLPAFEVDQLEEQWSGGDLVLQVAAEDPVTVSHAVRVLLTDADPFATVRWVQSGFHRPSGTAPVGMTGRNLFGQVDGTENPQPGTDDFAQVVWTGSEAPAWLLGGTSMVVRRIAMDLQVWGGLDVMTKEASIGRRLADGAPLTGGTERSAPDFAAVDADGFPVIPETSHIRLAHATAPGERILRRPYNYDDGVRPDGSADAGLVFVAFMADPERQFVPIQARLAGADVLNLWTTPIGSALFAVLPGVAPGEVLGQALLG
ncbi:MAG: Dyp-type peroxidase [Candidatus Nanopelagicales bacterium]|jgi:dye decolorizing peroxidase|nr:Dyp-type peroxidase [Candidatus Nanopelagicales bacterium]